MSNIDRVLERIKSALEELEKNDGISTKVTVDKNAGIIRIYGEGSNQVKRASSGLAEMLELSYTTAEHHPYWSILYHSAEISKNALEKWDLQLTADEVSEMSWRCDEIKMALDRLTHK